MTLLLNCKGLIGRKYYVVTVALVNYNPPVRRGSIQYQKTLWPLPGVDDIIHARKDVRVTHRDGISLPVVDAEAQ